MYKYIYKIFIQQKFIDSCQDNLNVTQKHITLKNTGQFFLIIHIVSHLEDIQANT